MLGREGTVEVHFDCAYFLALCNEVVYSFLNSLVYRTHCNDYALCVGSTVVVEEVVFTAGDFGDFGHVVFDDVGHCFVVLVASFAVLEENVAVFGHATCYGCLRRECARTEFCEGFAVEQGSEFFLRESLDFLNFVRCTEAIEEVDKWNA